MISCLRLESFDIAAAGVALGDLAVAVDDLAGGGPDDQIVDLRVVGRDLSIQFGSGEFHAHFVGEKALRVQVRYRYLEFVAAGRIESRQVTQVRRSEAL